MGAAPSVGSEAPSPIVLVANSAKGPILVSPKVITDPQNLSIKAIYNDKTVQDGNTK